MANTYYGKYRAQVVDVDDPQQRGRIRVLCPATLGKSKSSWCNPCIPVAYDYGGDFAVPKIGETVWIEFEGGDVNKPIYVGNWWKSNCTPSIPYDVHTRNINWGNCKIKMVGENSTDKTERLEIQVGSCSAKIVKDSSIEFNVGDSTITMDSSSIVISVGETSITLTASNIAEVIGSKSDETADVLVD